MKPLNLYASAELEFCRPSRGNVFNAVLAVCLLVLAVDVRAVDPSRPHLPVCRPGGVPAAPVIQGLSVSNQEVTLSWWGLRGPFQVWQNTNLAVPGSWVTVADSVSNNQVKLPQGQEHSLLKVSGLSVTYAGSAVCKLCHRSIATGVTATKHTAALSLLQSVGQDHNPACLPCHTVGYGTPTGFVDTNTTPTLAGVQCENCHGPAGEHADNPDDLSLVPPVDLAATVCGGCHQNTPDSHFPTFNEWQTSGHHAVVPEVAAEMAAPGGSNVITRCGSCHSGSVRMSMVKNNPTTWPLPDGTAAGATAVTCATCHDPHKVTANGDQLRNPVFSTNFYSQSTSIPFINQYNTNLNLCGQCHNARGAAWTDTSRPPHHSPQYNILLGNIGVLTNSTLTNTSLPATAMSPHWMITNQCAHCHMQTRSFANPTEANPNVTGHGFSVDFFDACFQCHWNPEGTKDAVQDFVKWRIGTLKTNLDLWATTKAPSSLRTNYGALAWEYNIPGRLSNPTSSTNIVGPTSTEQTNVAPNIKQARFNLYLVEHDGSYGVHNAFYADYILKVAEGKVNEELAKPPAP